MSFPYQYRINQIKISLPHATANKIEKVMLRKLSKFFFQLLFGKRWRETADYNLKKGFSVLFCT